MTALQTRLIQLTQNRLPLGEVTPLTPPLSLSTTFLRAMDGSYPEDIHYSRVGYPGVHALETVFAELDHGEVALVFASGMATVTCLLLALPQGSHILLPNRLHYGVDAWFAQLATQKNLSLHRVDLKKGTDVEEIFKKNKIDLVWIESPANPLWELVDITAVSCLARAHGASVLVDNTCASPILIRPLTLGADYVLYSATKILNGHHDVMGGVLVARQKNPLTDEIEQMRRLTGSLLPPFSLWLLQRGLRTLALRVHHASQSALKLALFLDEHAHVEEVFYPGLPSCPDYALAQTQMQGGFGVTLSFRVHGGKEAALRLIGNLTLFTRATSFGGLDSLIEHRASMKGEHAEIPADLLRVSVGIEEADDLRRDLEQGLAFLQS